MRNAVAIIAVSLLVSSHSRGQTVGIGVRLIDVMNRVDTTTAAQEIALGGAIERYRLQQDISDVYSAFDLAGNGGTFGINAPYPGGTTVPGNGNDFVVAVTANLTIPAGLWQIAFGSDDGGALTLSEASFINEFNENGPPSIVLPGDDTLWFEQPRSHEWTGGTIQLDEPLSTTLYGVFFERGGMDSFEIAIRDASAGEQSTVSLADGWTVLANGALGWQVLTDLTPGRRIGGQHLIGREQLAALASRPPGGGNLNYRPETALPLVFDVAGNTLASDQLALPSNPDPMLYRQVLDLDQARFVLELISGSLQPGDRLALIDRSNVDEIAGTPVFEFPFGQWDLSAFHSSGQVVLLSGAPSPTEERETTWNRPAGGAWSDLSNWDAGIPNTPGDVAVFHSAFPSANATITLDAPVTVAGVRTNNPRTLAITGAAAMTFDFGGNGNAPFIQLGSTAGNLRIAAPLDFPNGPLQVDVSRPLSELRLDGSISARSADMVKEGQGRLVLASDSRSWQGALTINGGTVQLLHSSGLGSTVGPTTLNAGRVEVKVLNDEPFTVAGGVLALDAQAGELTLDGGAVRVQSDVPIRFSSALGQNGDVYFPIDYNRPIRLPGALSPADGHAITLVGLGTDPNPYLDRVIAGPISITGGSAPLRLAGRGAELLVATPLTATNNITTVEVVEWLVEFDKQNTYTGQTIIRGGTLTLTGNGTLGAADGTPRTGTLVLAGGTLDTRGVEIPTAEWIGVDGGRIGGNFAGPVNLQSNSVVLAGGFRGPITGDASVVFSNLPDRVGTDLWEANTFTGKAIIAGDPGHHVHVYHPQSLGGSELPARLIGGQLHLHAAVDKPIVAEGGELHVHLSELESEVVLSGGSLLGAASEVSLASPLRLEGGSSRIATYRPDQLLNVNAPIEGFGDLHVAGINSDLWGSGPVFFHQAPAFDGNLWISSNEAHFNVAPKMTGQLILDRLTSNTFGGTAVFHVDAQAPLRLRGGYLVTDPDVTFTATNSVVSITGGGIDANLQGAETLLIDSPDGAYIGNLGESQAEIVIKRGTLTVARPDVLGSSSQGVVVDGLRDATFFIEGGHPGAGDIPVYTEPITVNGATGTFNTGGLRLSGWGNLAGDLTVLGENPIVGVSGDFTLTGPLRGDSFTLAGAGTLTIASTTEHTGPTRIGYGDLDHATLSVAPTGRLSSTSRVEIYQRGELHIDKRQLLAAADVIDDVVPIQMNGGRIVLDGSQSNTQPISEKIGPVTAVTGMAEFEVNNKWTNLVIESLARHPAATVLFQSFPGGRLPGEGDEVDPRIHIEQTPTLTHGILGGWAVAGMGWQSHYDFATYDTSGQLGVTALSRDGRKSQLAGATESDNVLLDATDTIEPLTSDTTVASLAIGNRELGRLDINLGGNQLTIGTGGIVASQRSYNLTGGTLTVGDEAGGMLFVHDFGVGNVIDAAITDGPGGEVSLVKSGDGYLHLRGQNTYRGDTIVNQGILYFDRPEAIPVTTDVVVTQGTIEPENDTVARVATVTMHDGYARGLHADSYRIESGSLSSTYGTGTVTKTSPNHAWVSLDGFAGTLEIQEGVVRTGISSSTSPAIIVREKGSLEFNENFGNRTLPHRITLDGGELSAYGGTYVVPDRIGPTVQVTADSRITVPQPFRHFRLEQGLDLSDGTTLAFEGPGVLEIEGNVQIRGQATIEHLGGRIELRGSWLADESVASPHVTLVGPGDAVLPDEIDFALMGDNRQYYGMMSIRDLTVRVTEPTALGTGQTILADGSTLVLEAPNTAGNIVVDGGQLLAGADASFIGDIVSRSAMSPGASPGKLRVEGSFHQQADGELIMDIASPLLVGNFYTRQHDFIEVTDLMELDGRLEVRLLHGYEPQDGDRFDLFDFDRVQGTFSRVDLPELSEGLAWDLSRLYTSGELLVGRDLVPLMPGDANQDLSFDQRDFVRILVGAKYLTGRPATWGEGDWNGGPGGHQGNPPAGDGRFDQKDIIAALRANVYLTGPYGALRPNGQIGDAQTSVVYDAKSGELVVDAPAGTELTSVNIDSASGIFTAEAAWNLGGSFDNDSDTNIFKATFGSSFGSVSFGNVAPAGLSAELILGDLSVIGSLAGGGGLGDVDLVYIPIPEPSAIVLAALGVSVAMLRQLNSESSRRSFTRFVEQRRVAKTVPLVTTKTGHPR